MTGSRASGTNTINADWDFFTKKTRELSQSLKNLGFVSRSTMYKDLSIVDVFRHPVGIDVQVISSVPWNAKVFANNFLLGTSSGRSLLKNLSKAEQSFVWNDVIDTYLAQ